MQALGFWGDGTFPAGRAAHLRQPPSPRASACATTPPCACSKPTGFAGL
ncbi:MAG: hypothetical protein WKG07_30720 [Hymenobacter sp.]